MNMPDWVLPTALFVVPVLVALGVNRLFSHRPANPNYILAWLVVVCWVSAIAVIWRQVR